jgi:hypothetical protein
MEVVEMARLGRLKVLVDRYPLRAAKQAYDDFEHGRRVHPEPVRPEMVGRAGVTTLVPDEE